MPLSWAAERFAFLVSGRDRAAEKRKVGGSTPPLTTTSEQRKRCCLLSQLPALLTVLLTLAFDGLGEDVANARRVFAQNVGVDAQGHSGVGVAEAGGYYVDRDAC